jgi:predicted RNA-binding protein YlqC (UPF0109 family)
MADCANDPRDANALALLKEIVACLVDDEAQVRIEANIRDGKVYVAVHASPRDVGFLIGKEGRMGDAIRTVFKGIGKQNHRSYLVYFKPESTSPVLSAF